MSFIERRIACVLITVLFPLSVSAQAPRFTWGDATPHGALALTEIARDDSGATVSVTYAAEARALPRDKRFQAWLQRRGDVVIGPLSVAGPDDRGSVRVPRVAAIGVAPGEIVRVALVSDDDAVRLFAAVTPLAAERAETDLEDPAIDVSIDFGDPGWQPADEEVNGGFAVTRWALQGEPPDTAAQVVTTTVLRRTSAVAAKQIAEGTRRDVERTCTGTAWHTFADAPGEIAYTWTAKRCTDGLPHVEIARVVDIDGHLVRVSYTAHATELTPPLAATWLERFQAAKVWRRATTR